MFVGLAALTGPAAVLMLFLPLETRAAGRASARDPAKSITAPATARALPTRIDVGSENSRGVFITSG
jgi:hypothetical protein